MIERTNKSYYESDKDYYLQTFKRYPITFEKGQGAFLWDIEGNKYVDALGGIAVNSLGHNHPKIVEAIKSQAEKLIHISNFYLSEPQLKLSQKLVEISKMGRVFLANSGAESVEGAIKIARKYAHSHGKGGDVISFTSSFHGRTLATIATAGEKMQKGFEPIPLGFKKAKFNDIESVKSLLDKDTAAIIIEPIQGEGGINIAKKEFLTELRELCDKTNTVLIFDEIQCGMGRTAKMFAKEHYGIEPDIMTLAKALGGGVPIGAILANEKVASKMDFGDHGTTFGGNPLVCAASLATINAIESENILQKAEENSSWFMNELNSIDDSRIKDIRGMGFMIGVEFSFETKELVNIMLKKGVLANATAGNVLRMLPPLNIEKQELEFILKILKESLKEIK
jgi:acetylornithine/N-succinyldiaminopimelate aminotransferase